MDTDRNLDNDTLAFLILGYTRQVAYESNRVRHALQHRNTSEWTRAAGVPSGWRYVAKSHLRMRRIRKRRLAALIAERDRRERMGTQIQRFTDDGRITLYSGTP